MSKQQTSQQSALFVGSFFDQLIQCGVQAVIVSPGSRSTPLAMVADASGLDLYVDIDERGAAFFALGLAKASKRPVCLVCTSGTAGANYLPALLEAKASRVPLIVLTADRPPRLQGLGAPQTCDQIKMFGDAVRAFHQMPLPGSEPRDLAFARQIALEACIEATSPAGAVHLNFPFEEPLVPDLKLLSELKTGEIGASRGGATQFSCTDSSAIKLSAAPSAPAVALEFSQEDSLPTFLKGEVRGAFGLEEAERLLDFIRGRRGIVLCGEGSFDTVEEAERLLAWASQQNLPLIADPLSGLRQFDERCVIDAYGGIFGTSERPSFDYFIRFGQYPISKRCFVDVNNDGPVQIVVDSYQTRDFNAATDMFIRASPAAFVSVLTDEGELLAENPAQQECFEEWVAQNKRARSRVAQVIAETEGFEGAFVHRIMGLAPENSLVFVANSLAIRMVDTFYLKANKQLTVLCNRGLNGIDGTTSSALGASQCFEKTTFLTGDLAFLHDLNALALQREVSERSHQKQVPSIVVVLFNNQGGGIFEMLPQQSDEPYFERLFGTPHDVDFCSICHGFGVAHTKTSNAEEAARIYEDLLEQPGIQVLEVSIPRAGIKQRYEAYL